MKLKTLVEQYIEYRKSLGEKFRTNSMYLRAFYNFIGKNISVNLISEQKVNKFLYGDNPITSAWFVKHTALFWFYNYAMVRGYIKNNPLPKVLPKRPPAFIPYIYSKDELRLILDTALIYQKNKSAIDPYVVRIVLLLLYSSGLRVSEALSLKLGDVDLAERVITVRETKFYKKRLVPFNDQLLKVFAEYLFWRKSKGGHQDDDTAFFISLKKQPVKADAIRGIFQRIREKAGINRTDGARYQPRLHDLRHTFAVHRLTGWYKEKKDVQKLLPILSTYMGHTHLAATSVYLTMTDELLHEANSRFQQYAIGDLS